VLERAAEAVELGDDELVAGAGGDQQRLVELRARGEFAAGLVDEHLVATGRGERVVLAVGVLVAGGDPPVVGAGAGFFISAVVQAWVPRERIEHALSGSGPGPIARATGLGAASSSCSYAAIAIARSLFSKGASAASALAFAFASTNLVWELGLVLWLLIGWQFTIAEYLGGIVMIVLMVAMLRLFVSRQLEQQAREHAREADSGHEHHSQAEALGWRQRLTSVRAWTEVAHNFRGDWMMLWKEITIGFFLAGFIAQFGNGFFESLFIHNAPAPLPTIENVVLGPIIAVLSFVCSIGNFPLAAGAVVGRHQLRRRARVPPPT
jgi:uncharacterized membrane protein YraQ (UPF0718 family)